MNEPAQQRSFHCPNCTKAIFIPANLPATTAPCPHCGSMITSPAPQVIAQENLMPRTPELVVNHEQPSNSVRPTNEKTSTGMLVTLLSLLALAVVACLGIFWFLQKRDQNSNKNPNQKTTSDEYKRNAFNNTGWKQEATNVLHKFISATTPEEKAKYVIGGEETLKRVQAVYGDKIMNESESPSDAFLPHTLAGEDTTRGLFLMGYDRPMQFDLRKFFRPLADIEVQRQIVEPDILLYALSRPQNFSMDALKIHAFFKQTDEGLKLDWDTYLQTRHRELSQFMNHPQLGKKEIFRLIVSEDAPLFNEKNKGLKIYRVSDPAHTEDSFRITVQASSEMAKQLSSLDWYGDIEKKPNIKSATLELEWIGTEKKPEVSISRFICWEFEGLGGGMEKKSDAIENTPEQLDQSAPSLAPDVLENKAH